MIEVDDVPAKLAPMATNDFASVRIFHIFSSVHELDVGGRAGLGGTLHGLKID
jgi:hypothetical protein